MNPIELPRAARGGLAGLNRQRRAANAADSLARIIAEPRVGLGVSLSRAAGNYTTPHGMLQRLFGTGIAANILNLTSRFGGASTRLYISDDDQFRIFSRLDEDPLSDFLQVILSLPCKCQ